VALARSVERVMVLVSRREPERRKELTLAPLPRASVVGWKRGEGAVAPGSVTRAASASPQRSGHCLARLMR
jgi:hypothetical protein